MHCKCQVLFSIPNFWSHPKHLYEHYIKTSPNFVISQKYVDHQCKTFYILIFTTSKLFESSKSSNFRAGPIDIAGKQRAYYFGKTLTYPSNLLMIQRITKRQKLRLTSTDFGENQIYSVEEKIKNYNLSVRIQCSNLQKQWRGSKCYVRNEGVQKHTPWKFLYNMCMYLSASIGNKEIKRLQFCSIGDNRA